MTKRPETLPLDAALREIFRELVHPSQDTIDHFERVLRDSALHKQIVVWIWLRVIWGKWPTP